MYKLCFALAFLAVATAKPNWLTYPSYGSLPAVPSLYPSAYSAYGPTVYSAAQTYQSIPLAAPAAPVPGPAFASAYSYSTPLKSVVAAPIASAPLTAAAFAAPAYPTTYAAQVAPVAPVAQLPLLSRYANGNAFAWKK